MQEDPEEATLPYHYGSHYSNSGTVLHFLVRMPPFTKMFLMYQGTYYLQMSYSTPDLMIRRIIDWGTLICGLVAGCSPRSLCLITAGSVTEICFWISVVGLAGCRAWGWGLPWLRCRWRRFQFIGFMYISFAFEY